MKKKTIWIFGTSASLEKTSYFPMLSKFIENENFIINNCSIGNQNSAMGLMRLHQNKADILPGDVVIWEYLLLDVIFRDFYEDGFSEIAFADACRIVSGLKAHLITLFIPPVKYLSGAISDRSCENSFRKLTKDFNGVFVDVREILNDICGITSVKDQVDQYRDDRHLKADSPANLAIAEELRSVLGAIKDIPDASPHQNLTLEWLSASDLFPDAEQYSKLHKNYSNHLVSVDAVTLPSSSLSAACVLPAHTKRLVSIGIVPAHSAGALWCGHNSCPPVSCRLPGNSSFGFLIQSTRMACVRGRVEKLVSAPQYAFQCGHWADYGASLAVDAGPVSIFGVLIERKEDAADADHQSVS